MILLCNTYLLTTFLQYTHYFILFSPAYIYINHSFYPTHIIFYPYFTVKASCGIISSTFLDTLIIVPLNCKGLRFHTCLQS